MRGSLTVSNRIEAGCPLAILVQSLVLLDIMGRKWDALQAIRPLLDFDIITVLLSEILGVLLSLEELSTLLNLYHQLLYFFCKCKI